MKAVMKTERGGLPVFHGKTLDDYVSQWRKIDAATERNLWALAAIAASLVTKYGDGQVREFSETVGVTGSRIYQLAATYRNFENSTRFENLSFKHHTIAARSASPGTAIAIAAKEGWSTRELEFYVETGVHPDAPQPKASEVSQSARKALRTVEQSEVVSLTGELRGLAKQYERFAPQLNKTIYQIEAHLMSVDAIIVRVRRALGIEEMLTLPELCEATGLDAALLDKPLRKLLDARRIEEMNRDGAAPRRRTDGRATDRIYYRMVAGPSQRSSQNR